MRNSRFAAVALILLLTPFFSFGAHTINSVVQSWPSGLVGVNYRWGALSDTIGPITDESPPPSTSFPMIKSLGFNMIRVPIFWKGYESNATLYLSYLNEVATYADKYGLKVVYCEYGTNGIPSTWQNSAGDYYVTGFPYNLTSQYASPTDFWNAWFANSVSYQGISGWYLYDQFWDIIIAHVDNHSSTLGYEIINEPQTPKDQFSELSSFQTYVAQHIRNETSKFILFMGPYNGGWVSGTSPSVESAPLGVSNVVYDGHDYSGSGSEIQTYVSIGENLGEPVFIGEWAICSAYVTCPTTQRGINSALSTYASQFYQRGLSSAYWGWTFGPANSSGHYQNLLDENGSEWSFDYSIAQALSLSPVQISTSSSSRTVVTGTDSHVVPPAVSNFQLAIFAIVVVAALLISAFVLLRTRNRRAVSVAERGNFSKTGSADFKTPNSISIFS